MKTNWWLALAVFVGFGLNAHGETIFDRIVASPSLEAFEAEVAEGFDFTKPYRLVDQKIIRWSEAGVRLFVRREFPAYLHEDLALYAGAEKKLTPEKRKAILEIVDFILAWDVGAENRLINIPVQTRHSEVFHLEQTQAPVTVDYYFPSLRRIAEYWCDVEIFKLLLKNGLNQAPEYFFEKGSWNTECDENPEWVELTKAFEKTLPPYTPEQIHLEDTRRCMADPVTREYLQAYMAAKAAQLPLLENSFLKLLKETNCDLTVAKEGALREPDLRIPMEEFKPDEKPN